MNKLLICSHGKLAEGMCDSLKIILGHNDNVDYLTFYNQNEGVMELSKISEYFSKNTEHKIIVLTDLYGGSVNQEVINQSVTYSNIRIISGMNFPVLLELAVRLGNEITDNDLIEIVNQCKEQLIFVENTSNTEYVDDFDF